MIRFQCPKCGERFEIEDEFVGVHAVCENCNVKMTIPQANGDEYVIAQLAESSDLQASGNALDEPSRSMPISQDRPAVAAPKLSPRQRRLMADWKNLTNRFSTFPFIQMKSYVGNPPEKYVIAYNVKGIERVDGEQIMYRNYHEVEIKLPGTYPRTPPLCRMLTPIFHPNIEPAVICIGDHWTAAERLCDLIVRIGEMIAYQAHNVKSPLDGEAAMWTDLHMDMLPIDSSDLTPPEL